jgi:ribosomal protein S18 acetylase RimI-like enzyme
VTEIRILDAGEAERERGRLAEILADCVNSGSSVSFMWPFTVHDAAAWWGGVIDTVASGKTILFGGYVEGSLVGTVQLSFDVPPNQLHRGDVRKLLVHREARRQGVAAALMTALEKTAQSSKLSLLTLDTGTGTPAERLYSELGFVKTGIIPGYALNPDGSVCDTTIFWKSLA